MTNNFCVYIVIRAEEHSDYVEKVFADKGKAEAYAAKYADNPDEYARHVEEHTVDGGIAALLTMEDIIGISIEEINRDTAESIDKSIEMIQSMSETLFKEFYKTGAYKILGIDVSEKDSKEAVIRKLHLYKTFH